MVLTDGIPACCSFLKHDVKDIRGRRVATSGGVFLRSRIQNSAIPIQNPDLVDDFEEISHTTVVRNSIGLSISTTVVWLNFSQAIYTTVVWHTMF